MVIMRVKGFTYTYVLLFSPVLSFLCAFINPIEAATIEDRNPSHSDNEFSDTISIHQSEDQKFIVYRDVIKHECYLERILETNSDHQPHSRTLFVGNSKITSTDSIYKELGQDVLNFCKNYSIFTLEERASNGRSRRRKREVLPSKKESFKGQTQTQYVSFDNVGKNDTGGIAEATAEQDKSRATVHGRLGMGQAQSQSGSADPCDELVGSFRPAGQFGSSYPLGQGSNIPPNVAGASQQPGQYGGPFYSSLLSSSGAGSSHQNGQYGGSGTSGTPTTTNAGAGSVGQNQPGLESAPGASIGSPISQGTGLLYPQQPEANAYQPGYGQGQGQDQGGLIAGSAQPFYIPQGSAGGIPQVGGQTSYPQQSGYNPQAGFAGGVPPVHTGGSAYVPQQGYTPSGGTDVSRFPGEGTLYPSGYVPQPGTGSANLLPTGYTPGYGSPYGSASYPSALGYTPQSNSGYIPPKVGEVGGASYPQQSGSGLQGSGANTALTGGGALQGTANLHPQQGYNPQGETKSGIIPGAVNGIYTPQTGPSYGQPSGPNQFQTGGGVYPQQPSYTQQGAGFPSTLPQTYQPVYGQQGGASSAAYPQNLPYPAQGGVFPQSSGQQFQGGIYPQRGGLSGTALFPRGASYPQPGAATYPQPVVGSGGYPQPGVTLTPGGAGYPQTSVSSVPGGGSYPQTGPPSVLGGGYPQTGVSSVPGGGSYPQTGISSIPGGAGYSQTGVSPVPGGGGYPQTGASSVPGGGYPQTGVSSISGGTGYPQTGVSSVLGGGSYPQSGVSPVPGGVSHPQAGATSTPGGFLTPQGGQTNVIYPPSSTGYSPQSNTGYFQGGGQGFDTSSGSQTNLLDTASGESQSLSSLNLNPNGTNAAASAQGKTRNGMAQAQVSGTYTGSFSAQAQTSDNEKSVQTQIFGNTTSASSSSQGKAGKSESQSQIQYNYNTGATLAESQGSGVNYNTNTQIQVGNRGGIADAQSTGPGSTSSQAQIGFLPTDLKRKHQSAQFEGGGTSSSQNSASSGQSQTQLQGSFKSGISFSGSAQSSAGKAQNKTKLAFDSSDLSSSINDSPNPTSTTERTTKQIVKKENDIVKSTVPLSSIPQNDQKYNARSTTLHNDPSQYQNAAIKSQTYDAYIDRDSADMRKPYLNAGQVVPGTDNYRIPNGFKGRIASTAGDTTHATTSSLGRAQTQTVLLKPGKGKVTVNNRNQYERQELQKDSNFIDNGRNSFDEYVTVTKSETGELSGDKKFAHTYYTKSSTCGYFTFTCNYIDGSNGRTKICKPGPLTYSDGTPC